MVGQVRLSLRNLFVETAGITALCLLANFLTINSATDPTLYQVPIWPSDGIALALLLTGRYATLPAIVVSSLITSFLLLPEPAPVGFAIAIAVGAVLQSLLALYQGRDCAPFTGAPKSSRDIGRFLLWCGPISTSVQAVLAITALYASGLLEPGEIDAVGFSHWTRLITGVLLFTPITLVLLNTDRAKIFRWHNGSLPVLLPLLTVSALLIFGRHLLYEINSRDSVIGANRAINTAAQHYLEPYRDAVERLKMIAHFLEASDEPSPGQFADFSNWMIQNSVLSSAKWAPLVTDEQRPEYERSHGYPITEPGPNGEPVPAALRSRYFPVELIINRHRPISALGLDVGQFDRHQTTIDEMLTSSELQLAPPAPDAKGNGLFTWGFVPVLGDTPRHGQFPIEGVVVGIFDIGKLIAPLLDETEKSDLAVRITDITDPNAPVVLLDADRQLADATTLTSYTLYLGGRSWRVDAAPLRLTDSSHSLELLRFYQLFTVVLSLFASYSTISLAERNSRSVQLIEDTSAELITQRSLRAEAEDQLTRFFSLATDLLCITNREGQLLRVNPAFIQAVGRPERELAGHRLFDFLNEADKQRTADHIASAASHSANSVLENRLLCATGEWRWLEWRMAAHSDGQVYALARDITDRIARQVKTEQLNKSLAKNVDEIRKANTTISNKEKEIRTLLDNLLECVLTLTPSGVIASVNRAAESVFGYRRDELIGAPIQRLVPSLQELDESAERGEAKRTLSRHLPRSRETIGIHRDGYEIPLEVSLTRYDANGKTMIAGTLHDISVQEALIQELIWARDAAEQANQAKSTFLATMSHEIRTPMNGVIGLIEILERDPNSVHVPSLVRTIQESAHTLMSLLDDILDFSKIEAGKLELDIQPLNPSALIEELCNTLVPVAVQKGVHLSLFIDPELPAQLLGDPVRLRQILVNIIGNGIKFSAGQEGTRGRVSVRVGGDGADSQLLKIRVADNGIGISAEARKTLLKPFVQAESSTTRRYGGTGLGLAICKQLIDRMDGRLSLHSWPDTGSVFTIKLPLPVADNGGASASLFPPLAGVSCLIVEDEDVNSEDLKTYLTHAGADVGICTAGTLGENVGGNSLILTCHEQIATQYPDRALIHLVHGTSRAPRCIDANRVELSIDALARSTLIEAVMLAAGLKASPQHSQHALSPPSSPLTGNHHYKLPAGYHILVAEDDPVNRLVIKQQLYLLGYRCDIVENGREALKQWQRQAYDLVLTDLHMPELDGYALISQIRTLEETGRHTPIIALTAVAITEERSRARSLGFDEYLVKPVQLDQLSNALTQYLRGNPINGCNLQLEAEVTTAPPAEQLFQVETLEQLLGNDQAALPEFLTLWLKTSADNMETLRTAFEESDYVGVAGIAHKLKSSSRAIGAPALGAALEQMERLAKADRKAEAASSMEQVDALYGATREAVMAWISTDKASTV